MKHLRVSSDILFLKFTVTNGMCDCTGSMLLRFGDCIKFVCTRFQGQSTYMLHWRTIENKIYTHVVRENFDIFCTVFISHNTSEYHQWWLIKFFLPHCISSSIFQLSFQSGNIPHSNWLNCIQVIFQKKLNFPEKCRPHISPLLNWVSSLWERWIS